MGSLDDYIELDRLEPRHKEALERFVEAQESGASWTVEDGVRSLRLPEGTFLATQAEENLGLIESWWSKVGAVLFLAGITFLTESKFRELMSLVVPPAVGSVALLAAAGAFLYRGYFVERRRRRDLRYRCGFYLLKDVLVERAAYDLCHVFPIACLRAFELREGLTRSAGGRTLYVGYQAEGSNGISWVPTTGSDSVKPLQAWLAKER
jgi:hypothetical protein